MSDNEWDELRDAWEPDLPPPGFSARVLDTCTSSVDAAAPWLGDGQNQNPAEPPGWEGGAPPIVGAARAPNVRDETKLSPHSGVERRNARLRRASIAVAAACVLGVGIRYLAPGRLPQREMVPAESVAPEARIPKATPPERSESITPDAVAPESGLLLNDQSDLEGMDPAPSHGSTADSSVAVLTEPDANGDLGPHDPMPPSKARERVVGAPPPKGGPRCSPYDPLCSSESTIGAAPPIAQSLGATDIQAVVNAGRAHIKRTCWESMDRPEGSKARVNVSMTIAKTGHVSRMGATGGEGFPGLATCVGALAKTWVFPASDADTAVTIPFQFVDSP